MSQKRPMTVLSIDFDYFQKISNPDIIVLHYPDGHDFSTELSVFMWGGHYANKESEKELKTVKIYKDAFDEVINAIKNNSDFDETVCKTEIVNSHKHIYDFIKDNYNKHLYNGLDVYNFDMHHDMFDTQQTVNNKNGKQTVTYQTHGLDCSNWATWLKHDFLNTTIRWICNPISRKLYESSFPDEITEDYTCIRNIKFDLIFLCRSDVYLPPHLDKYFDKMRQTIQDNFARTLIEKDITKPRDITDYVKQLRKTFSQIQTTKQ